MTDKDAEIAALRAALDRLTHATWTVLCEYGSAGVPMLIRMAEACDAAREPLKDTEGAAKAYEALIRDRTLAEVQEALKPLATSKTYTEYGEARREGYEYAYDTITEMRKPEP